MMAFAGAGGATSAQRLLAAQERARRAPLRAPITT